MQKNGAKSSYGLTMIRLPESHNILQIIVSLLLAKTPRYRMNSHDTPMKVPDFNYSKQFLNGMLKGKFKLPSFID